MPSSQVPIIKGDTIGIETDYRDALPVNMFAVKRDILGAKVYMLQYPGLSSFATAVGKDRGGNYNERHGNHYRISGGQLVSIDSSGTVTSLGPVHGQSQVAMPYSFNTQCIIADGRMYLYSPSGGFSEVTDPDLGIPIDGVWINGYYFLTDGEYIYHTDITNESSIDPLKFATAEFMPDKSLGVGKTQDNKVIVFGRYSLEYFVDAANTDFAFQRVESRAQKIGIVATHAKVETESGWYICGGRKGDCVSIHIVNIGSTQRVATREIDKIIGKYSEEDLSDIRLESYEEDGVRFVLVHLPSETLCFHDTAAKDFGPSVAWSVLKTDVAGSSPYRGINMVNDPRLGYWLCGDKIDGRVGKIDDTVATHYGELAEIIAYTPFLNLETASIDELSIETIPGRTDVSDATVAVSATYDGATFGNEVWMNYGARQKYGQRFIMYRLGYVSDWIGFKIRAASRSRMSFAMMRITYG